MSKKGKTLPGSTREIVYNIIQFCQHEKMMNDVIIDLHKATERVAAMTGLSRQTVSKIKKEGATNSGVWVTPGCHRTGRPKKIILDDNNKKAIRDKIRSFYTVRNEIPTLRKLHRALKEDNVINFTGGITTLRGVLKELGYKYEKGQSNKKILIEQPEPVEKNINNKKVQTKQTAKEKPPPQQDVIQPHDLIEHKIPPSAAPNLGRIWDMGCNSMNVHAGQVNMCWPGPEQPGMSRS